MADEAKPLSDTDKKVLREFAKRPPTGKQDYLKAVQKILKDRVKK